MSIDPTIEPPISLSDARDLPILPRRRGGNKPAVSTIHRWATVGVSGVVLETVRCGGTLCTTEAAIARFFAALTDGAPVETPTQRAQEARR